MARSSAPAQRVPGLAPGRPAVLVEGFRRRPVIVASHIPPRGAGDVATDDYHVGSPAYRWILDRLRPPLWLHGHTPLAGVHDWRVISGSTMIVNVTGAVLVDARVARAILTRVLERLALALEDEGEPGRIVDHERDIARSPQRPRNSVRRC